MKKTIVRRAPKASWNKKKKGSIMLSNDWIGKNVVVLTLVEYNTMYVSLNTHKRNLKKIKTILLQS